MNVIVAGDFCDNNRVSSFIKEGKYSLLFDGIRPIIKEADFAVVNFEFPVVMNEAHPIDKWGPSLKGSTSAVNAIKYAGFNICTLANNHIMDYGADSCMNTKQLLEENGIHTVGVGKNIYEASEILYIDHNNEKLAIINCCENEFSIADETTVGANPLNPISQYYKIREAKTKSDYVLVIVHGGTETYQLPSPRMQETYRFFIDSGADAVVNHHQHCYSGYEYYKEKPIIYGLGNLLFDKSDIPVGTWNEGYFVNLYFKNDSISINKIYPYKQCKEDVKIEMMNEEEKNEFEIIINRLNIIIADKLRLRAEYEEWTKRSRKRLLTIFEPYSSRITLGLYMRHLLPSFLCKKKKLEIRNYLFCESHVDALKILLSRNDIKGLKI